MSLLYQQRPASRWAIARRALTAVIALFFLRVLSFHLTPARSPSNECAILAAMERHESGGELQPKIIHLQWRTKTFSPGSMQHNVYQAYTNLFPLAEIRIWTDDEMLKLIADEFSWFLPIYTSYARNIQRIDSARYFILYKYGGLYSDLDYMPLGDFWNLLDPLHVSLAQSPINFAESVQNSLMASPKGHSFWLKIFEALKEQRHQKDISKSSGTGLLSRIADLNPDDVLILPCAVFMRLSPMRFTDNDVVTGFLYKYVLYYTPAMRSCGAFDLKDPCMLAAHYGTNTWADFFWMKEDKRTSSPVSG